MNVAVAVVIVNFNGGSLLEQCLSALQEQRYRRFRVIVVDNASSDGSAQNLEERFANVSVIRLAQNVGFAAGNNVGIAAAADCQWVALLNPDAFPEPGWLEALMSAAAGYGENAFFGCRMLQAKTPTLLDGTADVYHVSGLAWRRDHGAPASQGATEAVEIFGPCAAAALYHRRALVEVGGFDESYFCYFEDVDMAFRLRLRGYRCWYVPTAIVHHVGSAISGRRSDFTVYHGHRNLVWTFIKNMPGSLFWVYLPLHLLLNVTSVMAFVIRGQAVPIVKAKWDALKGLRKVLEVRRQIQSTRVVSAWAIRSIMARGLLSLWRRG